MLALLVSSCSEKKIDPYALPIAPEDLITAEFPPTREELVPVLEQMLILVAAGNGSVSQDRLDHILAFVRSGVHYYSNVTCIPPQELEEALKEKAFRAFQPDSVSEVIRLGRKLNARFAIQLRTTFKETKPNEGVDRFAAKVSLTAIRTDSGRIMFTESLEYNSSDPKRSMKTLGRQVQKYFPIQGFILETRGNRQVAKISVGRSLGVKLGRVFFVRERVIENMAVTGGVGKVTSYSRNVVAPVRVFRVMENESWVFIPKKNRSKIQLGQVLFSQPEKR